MDITSQPITRDLLAQMTRSELFDLVEAQQGVRKLLADRIAEQQTLNSELEAGLARVGGILVKFQNRIFGKSSERSKNGRTGTKPRGSVKPRSKVKKLPSKRYPDATVIERDVELKEQPDCKGCGHEMSDSGMTEVSEYLQVIPKDYVIIRQIQHKYRCSNCYSSVVTTPGMPRIKPGSAYGNEMMIDIAMSKYCDLLPIERYRAIGERQGFPDLPANSLIATTHHLSDYLSPVVDIIRGEVLDSQILFADETPHKMLEGSDKPNWYLWGFSSANACFFEYHDTRSGDVAFDILSEAHCEVLVTDVYAG